MTSLTPTFGATTLISLTPTLRAATLYSILIVLSWLLSGCGGSSPSAPDVTEAQADARPGLTDPPANTQPKTGSFVDSPVAGIHYKTDSYSGLTDETGAFQYFPNEIVEFSIAGLELGAAVAGATVTPEELGTLNDGEVDYESNHKDRTINTLRFLQTFDSDSYPENGISISEYTRDAISTLTSTATIEFNLDEASFESQPALIELILTATNGSELVPSTQAMLHFRTTLRNLEAQ